MQQVDSVQTGAILALITVCGFVLLREYLLLIRWNASFFATGFVVLSRRRTLPPQDASNAKEWDLPPLRGWFSQAKRLSPTTIALVTPVGTYPLFRATLTRSDEGHTIDLAARLNFGSVAFMLPICLVLAEYWLVWAVAGSGLVLDYFAEKRRLLRALDQV